MGLARFELTSGPAARWSLRLLEAPPGLAAARAADGCEIEAQVPGCVHTDLMRAGLLKDPNVGTDELQARWIGECSWRYTARFDVPETLFGGTANPERAYPPAGASPRDASASLDPSLRLDLVFEGIDTLATVRLNDIEVGAADNMHATWRLDVRKALRRGPNVLEIDFPAPLPFCRSELERYRREIGDFPFGGAGANPQLPHHMLRKMHCNFGWDWGPQLVTCGIWRALRIEAWRTARIAYVRPQVTEASPQRAVMEAHIDLERAQPGQDRLVLGVSLARGNGVHDHRASAGAELLWRHWANDDRGFGSDAARPISEIWRAELRVDQPHLWWPAGHGEQALYTLTTSLTTDDGALLDRQARTVGLRTYDWEAVKDEHCLSVAGVEQPRGAGLQLAVNGRRVFCKGANWIPDDCFAHRVTRERYRRRIGQARDANMNMLRVWGGGVYESDGFYDACDELGIMVWQDFATACSCYPEDDAFKRRFEHEARDNVARLAGRASLALWCGGNECIQAVHDWGPEYRRMRDVAYGWGKHYWYEMFPRIVAELDPETFYWPNSPWSADTARTSTPLAPGEVPSESASEADRADEMSPNLEHTGDCHIWDIWNGQGDWRNYWSHAPRFASEFGFHGPPTWPTLEQAVPPDQRHWFSQTCVLHNKQEGGQQRAIERAREHFRLSDSPAAPESFEAMWFVAALNQARALEAGCQWFRALSPWCSGALFWQLNDCWPVASWSAIDNDTSGEGRPKLLWYAARRFFAPRMCALLPDALVPAGHGHKAAHPRAYLHNDYPQLWMGELLLRLVSFVGEVLEEERASFEIEPGGSLRFIVPGHWKAQQDRLVTAEATGAARAVWFFGRDKDLSYPPAELELAARPEGAATSVTIMARTLLRDLCIFPERLDPEAKISDQLITLLPGQSATVQIAARRILTAGELRQPGVIWTANAYGLRPHGGR